MSQFKDGTFISYSDEPIEEYLRDLSERLRNIPVMYGVDGGDIDQLNTLAGEIKDLRGGTTNYQVIVINPATTDDEDLDAVIWVKAPTMSFVDNIIASQVLDPLTRTSELPADFTKEDGIDADLTMGEGRREFKRLLNDPPWSDGQ